MFDTIRNTLDRFVTAIMEACYSSVHFIFCIAVFVGGIYLIFRFSENRPLQVLVAALIVILLALSPFIARNYVLPFLIRLMEAVFFVFLYILTLSVPLLIIFKGFLRSIAKFLRDIFHPTVE